MPPLKGGQRLISIAGGLIAFGASIASGFHFDDYALLTDPLITSPSGWWKCWGWLQTRPLTWFTFWLNYQLGGASPVGYHIVNVLLHLAVAIVLFSVLKAL